MQGRKEKERKQSKQGWKEAIEGWKELREEGIERRTLRKDRWTWIINACEHVHIKVGCLQTLFWIHSL